MSRDARSTKPRASAWRRRRHLAGAALAVWYLLTPPINEVKKDTFVTDVKAPFGKWTVYRSFPTEQACKNAEKALKTIDQQDGPEGSQIAAGLIARNSATCLSSEDPRATK